MGGRGRLVGDKKEVNGCLAEREFIDFWLQDVCLCLSVGEVAAATGFTCWHVQHTLCPLHWTQMEFGAE